MTFSGSYRPEDVTFLLKRVQLEPTDVLEKERQIQSGQRHYSEMIGAETPPSDRYLRVFHEALARERNRFARDLFVLAKHIAAVRRDRITIVSLARAGTPIGVLLGRTLRGYFARPAQHYSVSIIRDRGIDEVALRHILQREPAGSIVFVDGWTGKGVIAHELDRAIASFNQHEGIRLDGGLRVVADLCGSAAFAATSDDYLIPSSVLGATISGLVSRSILNDTVILPGDFHGCLDLQELAPADLSRWFVDEIDAEIKRIGDVSHLGEGVAEAERTLLQATSATFLADIARRFGLRDVNHIKPGIGEATRVLLRRVPHRVLVRDSSRADIAHLLILAREKAVPVIKDPSLPYMAAALIKEFDG